VACSQVCPPPSSRVSRRSERSVSPTPGRCLDSGSEDEFTSGIAQDLEGMKLGAEEETQQETAESSEPASAEV